MVVKKINPNKHPPVDNVQKKLYFVHQQGRCVMSKANYDLPDEKLMRVIRLSGAKSKREAIIIALDEYLKKKKAEKLIQAYGKIPLSWDKRSLRSYRG